MLRHGKTGKPEGNLLKEMRNMEREQVTIRHPADQKEQLQREAEKRGVSYNALITEILNEERNHRQTK